MVTLVYTGVSNLGVSAVQLMHCDAIDIVGSVGEVVP